MTRPDKRNDKLNPRQARILAFIQRYTAQHGYSPSHKEIRREVRTGGGSLTYTMQKLARLGYIEYKKGSHRAIVIKDN